MQPKPAQPAAKEETHGGLSGLVHTALDGLGMAPGVGEPFDGINGLIYAAEGDAVNAGLSLSAMAPFGGNFVTGGKYLAKGAKEADKVVDAGKAADAERAAAASRRDGYTKDGEPDIGYHHTGDAVVDAILDSGLFKGSYVTDRVYSPGDATMYLSLPPSNANPGAVIKVKLADMRRDGIDVPKFGKVDPDNKQPGGGNEIVIAEPIDPKYLELVARGRK